ncbi:MAG TPA: NlpC/P60 family protein [Acidimicrobiales bacterium]|nr:NlpC/P60 family protein [Acidimicrobiales bacterium]
MAVSAALTSGLVVPSASADQMSDLQAQAAALAAKINSLGQQEEALAEKYDQAQYEVSNLQAQVATAQAQLAAAQATTEKARQALKADAIQAYVNGGNNPMSSSNAVQNATNSLLRAEYINTLASNQSEDIDQYRLAALQEQAAEAKLKQQQAAAQAKLNSLSSARQAVAATSAQLTSTQQKVSGEIAQLKAQELAAERAAAAAAAARKAAEEQAARQRAAQLAAEAAQLQASQPAPQASTVSVNYSPPPVGSGASGAVQAAESRVGDWYQWGASGPNTFDCSGLVMWAYEQVGISLPHYSGAQYNDTTHIPMSDLQPGDLVFFSDPGEHVAMYVGGGNIVEAAHTGTQVHIVPMYSGFTLAGRVA